MDDSMMRMALIGYEQERQRIEVEIQRVQAMLNGTAVTRKPTKKKRTMSAAARKRIGEATRLRWKRFRQAKAKAGK